MATNSLPLAVQAVNFSVHSAAGAPLLENISLRIPQKAVTAVIGPTNSGKSVFLRSINRLCEEDGAVRTSGQLLLADEDVYHPDTDLQLLRRRAGMIFSKPTLPMHTIFDNVTLSPKLLGITNRGKLAEICERTLRQVHLWDKLSMQLAQPAAALPLETQQRLCIARVLAGDPEVLLFDEPTASMDHPSVTQLEEIIRSLGKSYAVIVSTQTPQQAAHLADFTAFFYKHHMIEAGTTEQILTNPQSRETEAYITGRMV